MELGYIIAALIGLIVGGALGVWIRTVFASKGVSGTVFIVSDTDTGALYPYLESNISIEELANNNQATFYIRTAGKNSHK